MKGVVLLLAAMCVVCSFGGFYSGYMVNEPIPEDERSLCVGEEVNEYGHGIIDGEGEGGPPANRPPEYGRAGDQLERLVNDVACNPEHIGYHAVGSAVQSAYDLTFYKWYDVGETVREARQ